MRCDAWRFAATGIPLSVHTLGLDPVVAGGGRGACVRAAEVAPPLRNVVTIMRRWESTHTCWVFFRGRGRDLARRVCGVPCSRSSSGMRHTRGRDRDASGPDGRCCSSVHFHTTRHQTDAISRKPRSQRGTTVQRLSRSGFQRTAFGVRRPLDTADLLAGAVAKHSLHLRNAYLLAGCCAAHAMMPFLRGAGCNRRDERMRDSTGSGSGSSDADTQI